MKTADLRRALGARDLAELARFLDATPGAMPLPRAIGFLTAVVSAPSLLMPSEWHPLVLGEPESDSMAEVERTLGLALRLYNQIIARLDAADPMLPPDLDEPDTLAAWCAGYLEAAGRDEAWRGDEHAVMLLVPCAVLSGDFDLVGEKNSQGRVIEDPTRQHELCRQQLLPSILEIYRYWRARRTAPRPAGARPVVRSAPKVGRNDPCPCGSGQKFKRCCGIVH